MTEGQRGDPAPLRKEDDGRVRAATGGASNATSHSGRYICRRHDRTIAIRSPGEFQDYVTTMAWGVWARGGPLSPRDRSLLVMAMTAALGRMTEFRLHAGAMEQTGVTDEELDELLFQIAAYCGAPAALAARREIRTLRERRGERR